MEVTFTWLISSFEATCIPKAFVQLSNSTGDVANHPTLRVLTFVGDFTWFHLKFPRAIYGSLFSPFRISQAFAVRLVVLLLFSYRDLQYNLFANRKLHHVAFANAHWMWVCRLNLQKSCNDWTILQGCAAYRVIGWICIVVIAVPGVTENYTIKKEDFMVFVIIIIIIIITIFLSYTS